MSDIFEQTGLAKYDVKKNPNINEELRAKDYVQLTDSPGLEIPRHVYDLGQKLIAESPDDPDTTLAKLNSSYYLSRQLGVPLEEVYSNFDQTTEAYYGKVTPPQGTWESISNAYKTASIGVKIADLGYQLWLKRGDDGALYKQIQELEAQMPPEDTIKRSLPTYALKMGAQFLPSQIESFKAGAYQGAATAVAATALAAPPVALTGVGSLSIPLITTMAFTVGSAAGSVEKARQIETGSLYYDLLRYKDPISGGKINPKAAWAFSAAYGGLAAVVEMFEADTFFKQFPGIKDAAKKAITEPVAQAARSGATQKMLVKFIEKAKEVAKEKGGGILGETLQETLQEGLSVAAEEFAKQVTSRMDGNYMTPATEREITKRITDTMVGTALGMGALNIIPTMGNLFFPASDSVKGIAKNELMKAQEDRTTGPAYGKDELELFTRRMKEPLPSDYHIQVSETVPGEVYTLKMGTKNPDPETGKAKRYGWLRYEVNRDDMAVNILGYEKGASPNVNSALTQALMQRFPGWDINTKTKSPHIDALIQVLTNENPRGPEAGLQWYKTPAPQDQKITYDYMRDRIKEAKPGWSAEDIDFSVSYLDTWAKAMGTTGDKLANGIFAPGIIGERGAAVAAQGAYGAITEQWIDNEFKTMIQLTKNANPSTWMHEATHAAIFFALENRDKDPAVAKFLSELEGVMGVKEGDWNGIAPGWAEGYSGAKMHHEALAYAVEDYFLTGRTPEPKMEPLFHRIAKWLTDLYKSLKGARYKISPEIEAYFDRLFSSPESPLYELATTKSEEQARATIKPAENENLGGTVEPKAQKTINETGDQPKPDSTPPEQPMSELEIYQGYERARDMEDSGTPTAETGWYRSPHDGEWRYRSPEQRQADIDRPVKATAKAMDTPPAGNIEVSGYVKELYQHALPVTDSMRESVSQGQILFQKATPRDIEEANRQIEEVRARYQGTEQWMKAPNGKPTNLNERQWSQVRTEAFKKWFGDWENDPGNASKVLDENGEPEIFFHGTDVYFSEFVNKGTYTNSIDAKSGYFFTNNPKNAGVYAGMTKEILGVSSEVGRSLDNEISLLNKEYNQLNEDRYKNKTISETYYHKRKRDIEERIKEIREVYASMDYKESITDEAKKDWDLSEGRGWNNANTEHLRPQIMPVYINSRNPLIKENSWEMTAREAKTYTDQAIKNGNDGVAYLNRIDPILSDVVVVFSPEQIKSATGNVGTFDQNNPSILFQKAPPTDSEAFKEWFRDSKVVDEEGKPLVMYRGSTNENSVPREGNLIFVTPNRDFAENYSRGTPVYELYVKAQHIFDTSNGNDIEVYHQFEKDIDKSYFTNTQGTDRGALPPWQVQYELVKWLEKKGIQWDGIYFAESNRTASLAVKDSRQIKSVNNRGTWDPNDPRMLFQGELHSAINEISGILDAEGLQYDTHGTPGNGSRYITINDKGRSYWALVYNQGQTSKENQNIHADIEIPINKNWEPAFKQWLGGILGKELNTYEDRPREMKTLERGRFIFQGEGENAERDSIKTGQLAGIDDPSIAAIKDEARNFDTFEEFSSYVDTFFIDELEKLNKGEKIDETEKARLYKELWEAANLQETFGSDVKSWADSLVKNDYQGLKEYLDGIWQEILSGETYKFSPADVEEADRIKILKDRADRISGEIAEVVKAGAIRIGAKEKELSKKFMNSIMGVINKNPEAYARIYGEIFEIPELIAAAKVAEAKRYAEIEDPRFNEPRLTISQKAAIAEVIKNEEVGRKILRGDIVVGEDVMNYIASLKNESKDQKAKIEELKSEIKEDNKILGTWERRWVETSNRINQADEEIAKIEKRITTLRDSNKRIPQSLIDEQNALKRIRETMDAQRAKARKKIGNPARLQTTLTKVEEAARMKIAAKDSALRKRAIQRLRSHITQLTHQIMRKPSERVNATQAMAIMEIQKAIDPHAWGKKTQDTINSLRKELENNPALASEIGKEWLNRATKKNINEYTLSELEEMAAKVKALRNEGRVIFENKDKARKEEKFNLQGRIADILLHLPGAAKPGEEPNKDSFLGKIADKIKDFDYAFTKAQQFARIMDGAEGGPNYDLLITETNRAYRAEMDQVDRRMKTVMEAFKREGVNPEDWYKTEITVRGAGPGRTDKVLRKSDIMALELAFRNEDSRQAAIFGNFFSHFEKREMTEDDLYFEGASRFNAIRAAMDTVITEQDLRVLETIGGDGDETGRRLFATVADVENRVMEIVENYFPINREGVTGDPIDVQIAGDVLNRTPGTKRPPKNGFTKSRINISPRSQTPIKLDLLTTWTKSILAQEHYIANAKLGKKLNDIYLNNFMQEQVRAALGNQGVAYLKEYISEVKNPGSLRNIARWENSIKWLRGNLGAAYLGFRASSTIKQIITSPWPAIAYTGAHRFTAETFKCMVNPVKYVRDVEKLSTVLKHRSFDMAFEAVRTATAKTEAGRKILAAQEIAMKGLELADRFSVAIGWRAVFEKEMADHGNIQLAIEKADDMVLKTQPSSRGVDLAPIYRTGGEAIKMLLQFTAPMNVIWNNIRHDLPAAIKDKHYARAVGIMTSYIISGVLLSLATEGGSDDEEKKAARLAFYAFTQGTDSIPLIGADVTRLARTAITGDSGYQFPDTALPGATQVFDGLTTIANNPDNWIKGIEKFVGGVGLTVGAPVSGVNELIRLLSGDIGSLVGKPKKKD